MAAIMQHKSSFFDGDVMQSLIKLGEDISGKTYVDNDYTGASRSLRIIADHARSVDFLISDGVLPGNEGRGYVLRRLLRRAVFHGRLLGIEDAFLGRFIDAVNDVMGDAYPNLIENADLVKGIVNARRIVSPPRSTTVACTLTSSFLPSARGRASRQGRVHAP